MSVLDMAILTLKPEEVIHHLDQGSIYKSIAFTDEFYSQTATDSNENEATNYILDLYQSREFVPCDTRQELGRLNAEATEIESAINEIAEFEEANIRLAEAAAEAQAESIGQRVFADDVQSRADQSDGSSTDVEKRDGQSLSGPDQAERTAQSQQQKKPANARRKRQRISITARLV